jgi:hypothetical protein
MRLSFLFLFLLNSACFPERQRNGGNLKDPTHELNSSEKKYVKEAFAEINAWTKEHLQFRLKNRKIGEYLPSSGTYLYLTPNRKKAIAGEKPVVGTNPLLNPQTRDVFVKEWRERYYFYPNNYPYLDDHVLLMTKKEEGQKIFENDPALLSDTLDLQSVFPNSTLTFNHLAGNSLDHFHLHISPQPIPLAKVIEKGEIFSEIQGFTLKDSQIEAKIFDDNACTRGFYFAGKFEAMKSMLFPFLHEITSCAGFYYNLVLLPMQEGTYKSLVIVRWSPEERELKADPTMPYPVNPGSIELGGLMMIAKPVSLSPENKTDPYLDIKRLDKNLRQICDFTVFSPRDLGRFLKMNHCKTQF